MWTRSRALFERVRACRAAARRDGAGRARRGGGRHGVAGRRGRRVQLNKRPAVDVRGRRRAGGRRAEIARRPGRPWARSAQGWRAGLVGLTPVWAAVCVPARRVPARSVRASLPAAFRHDRWIAVDDRHGCPPTVGQRRVRARHDVPVTEAHRRRPLVDDRVGNARAKAAEAPGGDQRVGRSGCGAAARAGLAAFAARMTTVVHQPIAPALRSGCSSTR